MSESLSASKQVVDVGAGNNPDPRANVSLDRVPLSGVDIVHDLEERPWPFDTGSASRVIARHVVEHLQQPEEAFAEAARVLEGGGVFEVHVPIGLDAKTDPTHVNEWTWDTPDYFTASPPYDYGWELPFTLESREVEWWLDGAPRIFTEVVRRAERRYGPGKWLSSVPGLSGVLVVEYRRGER